MNTLTRIQNKEYIAKFALVAIYITYAILWNFAPPVWKLKDSLLHSTIKYKSELGYRHYDIAILGGSNAVIGLSAKELEGFFAGRRSAINLSISGSEGAEIFDYEQWVFKRKSSADVVVYSSMNFWFLGKNGPFDRRYDENLEEISTSMSPPPPAAPLIKNILIKSFEFDSSGDITTIKCDEVAQPFQSRKLFPDTIETNRVVALANKIKRFQTGLHASKAYIRIPPIYINEIDNPIVEAYVAQAKKLLKENNVDLIEGDAYTNNKETICFGSMHPTKLTRTKLTKSLGEFLERREGSSIKIATNK